MQEIQNCYLCENTGSLSQQRQKLEFTHRNSNIFSINSNTLSSVNGDRRRTDDATVIVSIGKKEIMPISGQ